MYIYILTNNNTLIYYLMNNEIVGLEGYTGTILEGYVKHPTFVKAFYNGETNYLESFVETATPEEIYADKLEKAKAIDYEYSEKISRLIGKHIERFIIEATPIPSSILAQRLLLIDECNDAIEALGVTEITYRTGISKK